MPAVPTVVADLVDAGFGATGAVVSTESLAPSLRRVRFRSDALGKRHREGKLGHGVCTVEFRVGRRDMRHYTACCWDFATGAFDVFFYLHGAGPGRDWAETLKLSDSVRILGPRGGVPARHASKHIVIGDETSLGHARALQDYAPAGVPVEGIVVCLPETAPFPAAVGLEAITALLVPDRALAPAAVLDWIARRGADPGARYHVTGNQTIVMAAVRALVKSLGVPREAIHQRIHWAAGKQGL